MQRRSFLTGLLLLPATSSLSAAAVSSGRHELRSVLDEAAAAFLTANPQSVGLSLGAIKGRHSFASGYGRIVRNSARRPDDRTIYALASISKTFTGVLLAQAALAGRVRLDDDVRKYVDGDFPNLEFEGEPVRLRHLLTHNSGLPFQLPDIPENRPPFPKPSAEVWARLASYGRGDFMRDLRSVELKARPGTRFGYSNSALILLSLILEKLHGKAFDQIVKDGITAPLEMNDTAIALSARQGAKLAPGHDEQGRYAAVEDRLLGAGALKSNVRDMLRYARWHMAETDPAVRLSHQPHPIDGNYSVGLNWQIMTGPAGRCIWQEGSLPGYGSMCVVLPEAGVAFVGLTNQFDPRTWTAFGQLTRRVLAALAPGATSLP